MSQERLSASQRAWREEHRRSEVVGKVGASLMCLVLVAAEAGVIWALVVASGLLALIGLPFGPRWMRDH